MKIMAKTRKNVLVIVGGILVLALMFFRTIVTFVTDYQWFRELGYTETFFKRLVTEFTIGIPALVIIFLIVYFYLRMIKRNYLAQSKVTLDPDKNKWMNRGLGGVSLLISLTTAISFATSLWFVWLQFANRTAFGVADPLFNNDIGFYVFTLPFLREVVSLILGLVFTLVILTVVFYAIMMTIAPPQSDVEEMEEVEYLGRRSFVDRNLSAKAKELNSKIIKAALHQVGALAFVILMLIGVNNWLRTFDLLYSATGKVYGAGYTDIHVYLWLYRALAILGVIAGISVLYGAYKRNKRIAILGPAILAIVAIAGTIVGGLVQNLVVEPNELSREKQYLEYNIDYTRQAYNLDEVDVINYEANTNLTKDIIAANPETIDNIRINDYRPVKQVYTQLQSIRLYYDFNDIDIDRYYIDGDYRQVFLSARELNQEKLDSQAQTWIGRHLKYTHGYGFVLSPVNEVTPQGQPALFVRNIPPITDTDLNIQRPEIYFGELTNQYAIINTDENEFDYSTGDANQETRYEGKAGIQLNGINKLLYAFRQGDLEILISGAVNSDSRIVLRRNILDRVKKLAPFILYDEDPYLVLNQDDGKMYWILDGYTTSSRYPYSQPISYESKVNYIRNSAKVVIDAYDGTTDFYIADESDPMIMTYDKIFKDLFKPMSDMPEGIRAHVRYPQTMFKVQSELYRTYHMTDPTVFYTREDIWNIAEEKYMEGVQTVEPNYVMFRLPDGGEAEFLLTIPYTPKGKPNMTSLFVARNDGDNYGDLVLYEFPKDKSVMGPIMLESRIDQNPEISSQLTLWGQQGSSVLRGNIIVIPLEDSLLYVEPIYLQADNANSLPEMRRVIAAHGDDIVMEETLEDALLALFGGTRTTDNEGNEVDLTGETLNELIGRAQNLYEEAQKAIQAGDWSSYGRYMDSLAKTLNELNSQTE
jgi:hypothetical protein